MFKKKHEFKPDKSRSCALNKLYITKKQRLALARWLLMAAGLVVLSVVQDVIMSRLRVFGATTDLVSCAILMICVLLDPEEGCVFGLVSSAVYWFSGSAPGPYVIALLTVFGVAFSIIRHAYLYKGFGSTFLCTAGAMMLYELAVFAVGLFLEYTTGARFGGFCLTGALSLLAVPVLYPIFVSIGKIGGESWKE